LLKRAMARMLSVLLVASSLLVAMAPTAAALGEDDYLKAALVLSQYGLVQGDERGLRFQDPINRAEMAKILVLSLGLESQVRGYVGRRDFSDTAGHWAEGYIALAKKLGVVKGYPEGDFRPGSPVTYAEVITLLARMVGLEPGSEAWPFTYIIPASNAGILSGDFGGTRQVTDPAIRGDVFVFTKRALADVKNFAGQTLAQRYLDQSPPNVDLDEQPIETQDAVLTVTGAVRDAALIKVNGTPVTTADGYLRVDIDLRIGPNTIRVQAWDAAGNLLERTVKVTRVQGTAASIELTGPTTLTAGQAAQYRLVVKDRNGLELADHKSVQVTVSPDLGTFDVATGTFTVGTKVGQGTLTAWAGSATARLNFSVAAGGLDHIAVTPGEVSLAPGQTVTFLATGYDAQGNAVPVTDLTWRAITGTIGSSGLYKAPSTGQPDTVTASAGGRIATAVVRPLNYQVATVIITQPTSTLRANGKSTLTLTATLLDAAGAIVKDYVGTVTVSSSSPGTAAPHPAAVAVVNGMATVTVQAGGTPGTATISVSTNLGKSGSAAVTVTPQSIQTVRITGIQQPSPTNDGSIMGVIEAQALDQDGNPVISALPQTVLVHIVPKPDTTAAPVPALTFLSNGQSEADIVLGPVDGTYGDVRSRTSVRYNPSSATFLLNGTVKPDALSYILVQPGALTTGLIGTPAQVRIEPIADTYAGQAHTIRVIIVDANGYRVTSAASLAGYSVSLRDHTGATWVPTVTAIAGSGRAEFTVTQVKTGAYTYTASMLPGGSPITAAANVVAGNVAAVTVRVTPDTLQADNASRATLHAEVVDALGNVVTSGSYPVTFSKITASGATQPFTERVVSTVNGVAEVQVTAARVVGPETYQASIAVPGVVVPQSLASATVTTRGTPDRLRVRYGDNDGDSVEGGPADNVVTAGTPITVIVEVLDTYGNVATFDTGRPITLTFRNMTTFGETSYPTVNSLNGKAVFYVNRPDSGRFAVKAETSGLLKALSVGYGGSVDDTVVQAGRTISLQVSTDLAQIRADNGASFALISAQMKDGSGNVTSNQTGLPVTVTLTSSQTVYDYGFFTIDDGVGSVRILSRKVVIAPGATTSPAVRFYAGGSVGTTTIQGTSPDGGIGSVAITATSIGGATTLRVDPVQSVAVEPWSNADSVITGQTVVATAVDTSGYRATGFGSAGEKLSVTTAGDAVIVAVYNAALRTWQSLDQAPGNSLGTYPTTALVDFDRGQAMFRVRANTPGIKVYTLTAASLAPPVVTGTFDPQSPDYLTVQVDNRQLSGGGDQMAIRARVKDQLGNTLTGVTGTVQFTVTPGAAGSLVSSTAELVGGLATVYFRSATNVAAAGGVTAAVTACSTLRRNDGTPLTVGTCTVSSATDSFTVDDTPSVTAVQFGNGGGVPNVVEALDTISFTFSEAVNGASVVGGLAAGGTVTGVTALGGMNVRLDPANSSISFPGLGGLGSISLTPGAVVGFGTYTISSIALNANGTILTVTLGPVSGGGSGSTVNMGGDATVVMNGAVRDLTGSGAFGPWAPLTPTGSF